MAIKQHGLWMAAGVIGLGAAIFSPLWAAAELGTTDAEFLSYDPSFQPTPVTIVPWTQLDKVKAPFVVTRLANGRLALMSRGATGKLEPFFVKAIETGYWDTRQRNNKTNWDDVFTTYRKMNANVCLLMIHWGEIEPQEGQFDFTFTDQVVATAKRHGVKIWWVFFMHEQGLPNRGRTFWGFNIENRDSANYGVQWVKDEHGNLLDSMEKIGKVRPSEVLPCYAHPKVFAYQNRAIRRLAQRYKDSDAVIGMQIGNEEGFIPSLPENRDSDFNPYNLKFYEDWKLKTGKSDWNAFKFNAVAYWWQRFSSSFHAEDPYKLTSFNLWGAFNEQGRTVVIRRTGADHTVYGQGNLDVVASMFYRDEARGVWNSLDSYYNYLYRLPILLPSEIGIGRNGSYTHAVGGSMAIFQEFAINALERGAAGYSAYCFGQMMGADGKPDRYGDSYGRLAGMVTSVEDVLHSGVPGPGDVRVSSPAEGLKVSHLHRSDGATVAILRFPEAAFSKGQSVPPSRVDFSVDDNPEKNDVQVEISAKSPGSYKITVYRDGELASSESMELQHGGRGELVLRGMRATEAVFLKAIRNR